MEDKELLELAAEAAGLKIEWKTGACKGGSYCAPFVDGEPWNPLKSKADAFDLAARLGLIVDFSRVSAGEPFKPHVVYLDELMDNGTAACLAIIRAAAQVALARRGAQ